MKEYHKIETVFNRDLGGTRKLVEGSFRNETVEFLQNINWVFTEKIDGTNIRIYWDGHKVSFGGRTDRADIPKPLLERLNELFSGETNEELFEQKFGDKEVILFGEGYGAKIQNGHDYKDTQDFILFDCLINGVWLSIDNCKDLAKTFNIECVPVVMNGTISEAINFIKTKPKSKIGTASMEGLIGKPKVELLDKNGDRIIVKVKVRDFE